MPFMPERLTEVRKSLNINKSEAARRIHTTAMGYGRYENGGRVPSYQVIQYMAEILGTSYEYLCGLTDDPAPTRAVVKKEDDPELFSLAQDVKDWDKDQKKKLLAYYEKLKKKAELKAGDSEE